MPPPLPRSVTRGPELELLNARIASLETERDTFGLGRALAELAVAHELAEDDTLAIDAAESALAKDPTLFAMHGVLRRKLHSRSNVSSLLGHVEAELAHASEGALRTGLLAERARLLGALGRGDDALAAWSLVLQNDPRNAAALRGKEVAIANQPGAGRDR